jgi:DNA-binding response OmpR family regulator
VSRGQQVGKRTRQPDVIIFDLGFPDLDGLEIIRRIRE